MENWNAAGKGETENRPRLSRLKLPANAMLEISGERRLAELQADFSRRFPFLKLEFYGRAHRPGEGTAEQLRLAPQLTVAAVQQQPRAGWVALDGNLPTGYFEQSLQEQFGLNVQVFRQSFGRWLQTWATDVWTLEEQNRRGELMGDLGVVLD